jgi:hypothetical protein
VLEADGAGCPLRAQRERPPALLERSSVTVQAK